MNPTSSYATKIHRNGKISLGDLAERPWQAGSEGVRMRQEREKAARKGPNHAGGGDFLLAWAVCQVTMGNHLLAVVGGKSAALRGGVEQRRRGVGVADRAGFENQCAFGYRGFESRPLRFFSARLTLDRACQRMENAVACPSANHRCETGTSISAGSTVRF